MFLELLEKIGSGLDAVGIPYMVIGGQAVLVHGEARLTRDIDITVGLETSRIQELLRSISGLGLRSLVDAEVFARDTMVLPCEDLESRIRVDFVFATSKYEREALARAISKDIGNTKVRFATAEDLVVHKIVAGRPRDLDDARSIVLKQATLDRKFVRRMLRDFQDALAEPFVARFDELVASCSD
ncbi:MAG: nucleotidyltransferase [Planctomycetes bacterium]|nr:nucleotidyltransferase [Planctomycetota bacterium]